MEGSREVIDQLKADRTFIDRLIGAARFDILTYEEVEHDETLTGQAALVVVLVAVARAIGGIDAGSSGADNIGTAVANARGAPQHGRILINIGRKGILDDLPVHRCGRGDEDRVNRRIVQHFTILRRRLHIGQGPACTPKHDLIGVAYRDELGFLDAADR